MTAPRPELLLHPFIPKPLHGLNPRTLLGQEWWDVQRRAAYKRTNYHCAACGVHKLNALYHRWLEAHEAYRIDYERGRAEVVEINALCHACHSFIHSGRLTALLQKGAISIARYETIINHGNKILHRHKLKVNLASPEMARWEDWRLVIDGKEFEPLWKNEQEWYRHYSS